MYAGTHTVNHWHRFITHGAMPPSRTLPGTHASGSTFLLTALLACTLQHTPTLAHPRAGTHVGPYTDTHIHTVTCAHCNKHSCWHTHVVVTLTDTCLTHTVERKAMPTLAPTDTHQTSVHTDWHPTGTSCQTLGLPTHSSRPHMARSGNTHHTGWSHPPGAWEKQVPSICCFVSL